MKKLLPIDEFAKLKDTTAASILLRAAVGEFKLFHYHGTKEYKDLSSEDSFLIDSYVIDPESKGFYPLTKWEAGDLSAFGALNKNDAVSLFVTNKGVYEGQLEEKNATINRDSLMVLMSEGSAGETKDINLPKRKDDVCNAMLFYINKFEKLRGRTPECSELWNELKDNPLDEWGLTFNSGKSHFEKEAGTPTDYDAFKDRYGRYYPKTK